MYNTQAVKNAAIAQPVERILGKDEVASSNLASSSKKTGIFGFRSFFITKIACGCIKLRWIGYTIGYKKIGSAAMLCGIIFKKIIDCYAVELCHLLVCGHGALLIAVFISA